MAMALLPMLASQGANGQSQQDQALAQVMPSKNGEQQADASGGGGSGGIAAPSNNNAGGAQILSMLSKIGQTNNVANPQGGQAAVPGQPGVPTAQNVPGMQTQTSGTQPVSTLATNANGQPANGSDFGAFLMQLMGGR